MTDLRILTLILIVIAAALRSEIFFYLLYILIGLQLLAWLWIWRTSRALHSSRKLPPAAFPGEPVDIHITIRNKSLLPIPWLSLYESVPAVLGIPDSIRRVISLGAREQRTVSYTVQGQRRGLYQLGPMRLHTGDVLGLREKPLENQQADTLTIFPQVLPLPELGLPAALPFGAQPAARSLFHDPARAMGVRGYQSGDSMRQIDWKNSARVGELQVRRYEPAIARASIIALAFSQPEYPGRFGYNDQERAIVAAASIAAHLTTNNQSVGLYTNGLDPLSNTAAKPILSDTGKVQLNTILRLLGRLANNTQPTSDITAMLNSASASLSWGSTLILITAQSPAQLIERLLPLRRRGLQIALVLIEARPVEIALARSHHIAVYMLDRSGAPAP